MKEITEISAEMAQSLLKMSTDTYMQYKYILLAVSKKRNGANHFVRTLFGLTDAHRPLCIEMKEVGTV